MKILLALLVFLGGCAALAVKTRQEVVEQHLQECAKDTNTSANNFYVDPDRTKGFDIWVRPAGARGIGAMVRCLNARGVTVGM